MFRAFSVAAALAAVALAVLGSWVRINGAGLTCPDWPLCHGQLIPALRGGVVLEWSHRAVALVESVLVAGAVATGWRARRDIAYVTPVLWFIAVTFLLQVLLGGATVQLANSPLSVMLHWATGMLFVAGLTALAVLALERPRRPAARPPQGGLRALLAAAAGLGFIAMCAGSYVSSSGAGLACVTFPACDGHWFGTSAAQAAHMIHRFAAAAFFVAATVAAYASLGAGGARVRGATLCGYALLVLQIALGVANVAWSLPLALRETHAANAVAAFLAFVVAWVFATFDGTAERAPAHGRLRAPVASPP